MSVFDRFRGKNRSPTPSKPTESATYQMVTTWGEYYYAWDGKLYQSDLIRACIRPKVKAIGKLVPKQVQDSKNGMKVDSKQYIKNLLKYPNPYMTGQMFQEKMATQLCLNNNAFALIVRDPSNQMPMELYPIPCTMVEGLWGDDGELYLRFTYQNGKMNIFNYKDVLHLRQDFNDDDIFGTNPGPALAQLMDCVGTIDQGIVKAIKNSGMIRWLLKFNQSMRPEDIKANTQRFVDDYLSYETDTFGAAGVDAKTEAKQIEPKDYVPNSSQMDRITDRIYSFFGTNKNIVQSSWTEDQWNAYYEAEIEPVAIQFGECLTSKLFTKKEIGFGNRIIYESSNLQCASMATKLQFVQLWDRGIMNANEIREILNLPPVPEGDQYYVRLDNAPVDSDTKQLTDMIDESMTYSYNPLEGGEDE